MIVFVQMGHLKNPFQKTVPLVHLFQAFALHVQFKDAQIAKMEATYQIILNVINA